MKKFLTNNLGLKILAVIISFVVWLVVVNYDDPVKTASFSNIPIQIKNEDVLREKGKVFEVKNEVSSIDVTITAKRTILDSLSAENIMAVADVSNLSVMNTVALQLSTNKNNSLIESIKTDTPVLELLVENLKEISLPITMEVLGKPAEGYVIGDVTYGTNTVRVSGPESVIDMISTANCSISVDERTSDISSSLDIELYDKNYERVDHPNLRKNISTINVSVAVLPTKTIPVYYETSGSPAENFIMVGSAEADKSEVVVAGRVRPLNSIVSVRVGSKELNLEGVTEDFTAKVSISNYLPEGIKLVTEKPEDDIATVTIHIDEMQHRAFSIPFSSIELLNIPDGYTAKLVNDNGGDEGAVKVKLFGRKTYLDKLDISENIGSVDVAEAVGDAKLRDEFEVTANVTGSRDRDDDITLLESEKVRVRLTKK